MAIKWLSQVEYAAHRGVSQPAVAKAIKVGRISEALGPDRRINRDLADKLWAANTSVFKGGKSGAKVITSEPVITAKRRGRPPAAAGGGKPTSSPAMQRRGRPPHKDSELELSAELATLGIPGGKVPTLNASRAIYEHYKARTAQIEHEERLGQLVPIEKVRKDAFAMARITRDALLAIPDRLASELAGITDQFEIHAKITGEIKAALAEIDRTAQL